MESHPHFHKTLVTFFLFECIDIRNGIKRRDKMKVETMKEIPRRENNNCAPCICSPQRTQGLKAPAPRGEHLLVNLKGPGVFLGAHVSKQGGTNDITFVILDIDGQNVTNLSFAAAENLGFTQQNPYGLVLLKSSAIKNLTIGFPSPLCFKKELKLSVTVNEDGIAQIIANVIHGKQ